MDDGQREAGVKVVRCPRRVAVMIEAVAYGRCVVDGLAVRALAVVGIERPQHFLCRRQRAERMQLCVRPFLHLVQQVETPVTFIIIIRESVFNLNVVVVLLVKGEGQFGVDTDVVCAVDVGTITVIKRPTPARDPL